jgi:hypothetical protein
VRAQSVAVTSRKARWHQSTLSTLLDGCSWQYFLTYIAELEHPLNGSAAVGIAYHAAVEKAQKARFKNKETTLEKLIQYGIKELQILTDNIELETPLKASLTNYHKYIRPYLEDYEPVAIEPEFTIDLVNNARPVGGYIDGVYRDPDTGAHFIIDHKTVGNYSRWKDGDGHRHQAAMYSVALALSDKFPQIETLPEMRYLLVRTSIGKRSNFEEHRIITVQPDLADVQVLGERVREAERLVQERDFRKNTGWNLCSEKWCPYYERCILTGELSGDPEEILSQIVGDSDTQ